MTIMTIDGIKYRLSRIENKIDDLNRIIYSLVFKKYEELNIKNIERITKLTEIHEKLSELYLERNNVQIAIIEHNVKEEEKIIKRLK